MPRTALGRGLGSLIQEVESAREGLQEIPVNAVDPNPLQPRTHFPESRLKELSDSIRSSGVVQPILVRKVGDRFQIVAGERRWRAAKLAGLERVPAVVRSLSDRDTLQLALTENMMREDLNPLDVARGMEAMIQRFAFRHEEIAQRLGVDRSTVTNTLRLLKLPEEVQDLLQEGEAHPRARSRPLIDVRPSPSSQIGKTKSPTKDSPCARSKLWSRGRENGPKYRLHPKGWTQTSRQQSASSNALLVRRFNF